MELEQKIKNLAKETGFDLVGISKLKNSDNSIYFKQWLADNRHGDMKWMEKNINRRLAPNNHLFGKALSVITVGLYYGPIDIPEKYLSDSSRGIIAGYARYDDYHKIMERMLKNLALKIGKELNSSWHWHAYVDTGPVLEKEIGQMSGLGFVGKNTTLINPVLGSYFFLGEIISDLYLSTMEMNKTKTVGTCGLCTRCLQACPTNALLAPYKLDARRCISYLTIENKGAIPIKFRHLLKNRIYGCDICQQVCPWNKKVGNKFASKLSLRPEMVAPKLLDLAVLSEQEFAKYFASSPVLRIKRQGLLRNVLVALGNWGDQKAEPVLRKIIKEENELLKEHAVWALQSLKSTKSACRK